MAYDATSGFHDIKPLPEFSPTPLWILILGSIILTAIALYLAQKLYKKLRKIPEINISPEEKLEQGLEQLKRLKGKKEISVRELSSRLSLLEREYLEEKLAFNAPDMTYEELRVALNKVLLGKAGFSEERKEEIKQLVGETLKKFDAITYSNQSEGIELGNSLFDEIFSSLSVLPELFFKQEPLKQEEENQ